MKGKMKIPAFKHWEKKYNFQEEDDIEDQVENLCAGEEHANELVVTESSVKINDQKFGEDVVRMFKELRVETQEELIRELSNQLEGFSMVKLPSESDDEYRLRCFLELEKKLPSEVLLLWTFIEGGPPLEYRMLSRSDEAKRTSSNYLKNELFKVKTFDLRGGESQDGQGSSKSQ